MKHTTHNSIFGLEKSDTHTHARARGKTSQQHQRTQRDGCVSQPALPALSPWRYSPQNAHLRETERASARFLTERKHSTSPGRQPPSLTWSTFRRRRARDAGGRSPAAARHWTRGRARAVRIPCRRSLGCFQAQQKLCHRQAMRTSRCTHADTCDVSSLGRLWAER